MKRSVAARLDTNPRTASTADCETSIQTCSLESNTLFRGKLVTSVVPRRDSLLIVVAAIARHSCPITAMAPRRAAADASPSPFRRLRLQADHRLRRHRISRRKVQTLSMKEIGRIETLSEGYASAAKEETDHETETETETETRWERSTRGDARALWVEQLYRYEEL
ncbi:hypothetical protein V8C34DRAFT_293544 [Trichoderma compactum]